MADDIDSVVIPVTPPFRTINYTGREVLTSYSLPFAKFYFDLVRTETDLKFYSSKRIVWDYGDGTITEAITGTHSYSLPGKYNVTCYLYDRQGNS